MKYNNSFKNFLEIFNLCLYDHFSAKVLAEVENFLGRSDVNVFAIKLIIAYYNPKIT